MNWDQFTSLPNGTRVFNHGWDQCVALANLYHESVIGGSFVPVSSAYQWWTDFGSYPTLFRNYRKSHIPVRGAIFVARGGIYNLPDGHIGVVTSVNSNGTFNTMEQNAGTWRYVGRYTRSMANVYGFLVPNTNPAGGESSGSSAQNTTTQKRRKSVATLYYSTSNDKMGGKGGVNPTYYLAGDSPGTSANWLMTRDLSVATGWAKAHGDAVWLTKASISDFAKKYSEPVRTR